MAATDSRFYSKETEMALKGTLADLGIVDLLQFPHSGRKTGELVISSGKLAARLFYLDGALIHADFGGRSGLEAIVEVVGWSAGEFEFNPGVLTEQRSVDQDLHRVVMQALKTSDERKMEQQRRRVEDEARKQRLLTQNIVPEVSRKLRDFNQAYSFISHSCVIDPRGQLLAEASRDSQSSAGIEELRMAVHVLRKDYPRVGLQKLFVEDQHGMVLVVPLASSGLLMVIADRGPAMGAVAMSVNKLVASLADEGAR
jgi:predicted regulator of Ras-like GTPase activity (Roadblock/LC7/MglB family)